MIRTRVYRNGVLDAENFDVDEVSDRLAEPDTVVWMDLCEPAADEFTVLAREFGLHELAVEDALHPRERPKLDRYPDHLLLTMYAAWIEPGTTALSTTEIAAFVTPRYLITVRKDDAFSIDAVVRAWDESPEITKCGAGFLVHGLLDVVVDGHFAAVEAFDEEVEALEDLLFADRRDERELQRRTFALRKSLVTLRRVVLPMRDLVNGLMRPDVGIVDEATTPYYRDVYDHVQRATEWTESLRELVTTILETQLTSQGNRLNETMKRLTGWAAIIAVPTAVTGFYGQNVPYPGYNTHGGFVVSALLLVGLSIALYVAFRRQDWL